MTARKLAFTVLCISLINSLFAPKTAFSQVFTTGIATTYKVTDANRQDGDIVALTSEKDVLELTKVPYEQKMYGVIQMNPPILLRKTSDGIPVIHTGEVMVNITTINGTIQVGDYITTSQIPGKGMKATELSGYMLGTALENFDESQGKAIEYEGQEAIEGKISVSVGIGPASPILQRVGGGILGTLRNIATATLYNISTTKETDRLIRYMLAIIISIMTIFMSFRLFGKNITKGVESIGRNPLAKASIQSMIVLNIILTALVSVGGILLSLAIISL